MLDNLAGLAQVTPSGDDPFNCAGQVQPNQAGQLVRAAIHNRAFDGTPF
jgi:hypothetical protein